MISYSRQQIERQLVADQALWRKVPPAASAVVFPLEILLLGWDPGWRVGIITVVLLGTASAILPRSLKVSIYLIDLLERVVALPMELCWLLLVWHLSARQPLFPILGQPLAGAVVVTASLWALTRFLSLVSRFASRLAFHWAQP